MPTEPPDPLPCNEADRAAVRRHNVELLTRLSDAATAWAIELLQTRPPTPAAAEQTAATFERTCRGVRRAVLLVEQLLAPPRPPPVRRPAEPPPPRPRPPPARRLNAAEREHRDRMDKLDRLDSVTDDEFDKWPDADLLIGLCHALKIAPTGKDGTPRSWDQAAAIHHLREAAWQRAHPPPDTS